METFSSTATIGDLLAMLQPDVYVRQSSERDDRATAEEEFEIRVMNASDDDVCAFIAKNFIQRDILCSRAQCAYAELLQWLEDNRRMAVESGASIVIRRKCDGKVMAATMSFDYHSAPSLTKGITAKKGLICKKTAVLRKKSTLSVIGAFLDVCLDPKVQPGPEDKWLYVAMLAAEEKEVSPRQRLQFVEDLEKETVKRAKQMGYQAIETINTSEVTTVSSFVLTAEVATELFHFPCFFPSENM